jgi:hypothetical protein
MQGDNSSTKVISWGRDGPVKREVTHSERFASSHRRTRAEDISSPLFLGLRGDATPRASTPVVPPPAPAPATTSKRRFRLPTGLPLSPNAPRASGLTPSQAGDINFETRLASYSDDELNSINTNSRKMSNEERRWFKDDTWVDILATSHSRRASKLIRTQNIEVPLAVRDHSTLVFCTLKLRVWKSCRCSRAFVPLSPLRRRRRRH